MHSSSMSPGHEVLWRPREDARDTSRVGRFMSWLTAETGRRLDTFDDLWTWSTTDLDAFWLAVWRYFSPLATTSADGVTPAVALAERAMPGAVWFPDVKINYAENMLRLLGRAPDDVIVLAHSQTRPESRLTVAQLRDQVARAAHGLRHLGVSRGDRVVAYAPNIPETLVSLLATASLGAVFSSCAPELGFRSAVDRWRQIDPKVVIATDGYRYGAKSIERRDEVRAIVEAVQSVEATVWIPYLHPEATPPTGTISWSTLLELPAALHFERVPFDHPLWVLFSSGTTGLPKPIVHSHGGITVEHLKSHALELDLGPADRFFWFSTTGWTMWNILIGGLLAGAAIVMYDGDPGTPDLGEMWRMASDLKVTFFGASAPYFMHCRKTGVVPRELADLSAIRAVGSTGAPLPPEGFRWVYEAVGQDVLLGSLSGGTDVCTGFFGSSPLLPVYAGEFACRALGAAVAAYDAKGREIFDEVGELVVTEPMPTMPLGFWGDADGSRYRAAYFADFPGVWRHGDWVEIHRDGSAVIQGRSDATLNRGGIRLGTSEFYAVVEAMPEVADSLIVHLEDGTAGGVGRLVLFVHTADGIALDEQLSQRIRHELRTKLSPRHVPDDVVSVPVVPRTLSGKKLEVPVKRILNGERASAVASPGSLTNPEALEVYERLRRNGR